MTLAAPRLPRHLLRAVAAAALGVTAAAACDQNEPAYCPEGSESCPCSPELECLGELACRSYYCVDLSSSPAGASSSPNGDPGPASGGTSGDQGSASVDNVADCENALTQLSCRGVDIGQYLRCEDYAASPCDVSDYFDCLSDNFSCVDGVPDVSKWASCASLSQC